MAKLYFEYGAMGSSKSAQALITKFNYEELGMTVWLIKPSVDTRDGADIIKSSIGLAKKADIILPEDNIIEKFDQHPGMDVIIADECQFFTPEQIDQLRTLVDERDMPVICFGLRTDFLTHLFPGSRRVIRAGVGQNGEFELAAQVLRVQNPLSKLRGKQRQNFLRVYRLGLPGRQEFFRLHPDKFLPDALARCARFITDKLHEKMRRASFFTACQRSVL